MVLQAQNILKNTLHYLNQKKVQICVMKSIFGCSVASEEH